MTVYVLLFIYFAAGAAFEQSQQVARARRPAGASIPLRFGGLIIALVVGLRYQVGADWFTYLQIFRDTSWVDFSTTLGRGDPGYQAFCGMVPQTLVERPKAGFAIPVGEWIKGPLRPWAEDLLSPQSLACDGLLNPAIVRRRWSDHLSGRRDSTVALWSILMLQSWLRDQRSAQPRAE